MTLPDASNPNAALVVRGLLQSLLSLLLCLLAPMARAQAQPDSALAQPGATLSDWEQLTPAQREQLIDPLRERWNSDPQTRARLMDNAQRWQQMSPEQRERAQRGLKRLEQMTPEQRKQAREAYQRMQQMPEAERRALREERLQKTSPEPRRHRRQRQR